MSGSRLSPMSWSKPLICLLAAGAVIHAASADVPRFEVDPFWPKPLPNSYYMGELGAVFVDATDHVWVASRPRTLTPTILLAKYSTLTPGSHFISSPGFESGIVPN